MKEKALKQVSTVLLRVAVLVLGLIILGTCLFVVTPSVINQDLGYYRPLLAFLYIPALPFFFALYQSMKILHYIDRNQAFSAGSVTALKNIKYCALGISVLFALVSPYVYYVADKDDAPGVLLLALIVISASLTVAAAGDMLQRLVQHGVNLKEENDLTV